MSGTAWRWAELPQGAARCRAGLLIFDVPSRDVNVLDAGVLAELRERIREIRSLNLEAVVLASGKEGFCAGADVDVIAGVTSAAEGEAKAALGQAVYRELASCGVPVVAAIHGACVGGGAELAAWCAARVGTWDERTRIGFPEVQLGIVPGFGGTQRLPGIVGLRSAFDLASSGRLLGAKQAQRIGLLDAVVEREFLLVEAARWCDRLRDGAAPNRPAGHEGHRGHAASGTPKAWREGGPERRAAPTEGGGTGWSPHRRRRDWTSWPLLRDVVTKLARRAAMKATRGRYPAPLEAIRLCRLSLSTPLDEGLREEARALGALVVGDTCRNLLHVYALKREAERGGRRPPKGALVGVLGAGVMGAGIAGVAAGKGFRARVRDLDAQALARGQAAIADITSRATRHARDPRLAARQALDRASFSLALDGLEGADLVVEAVVERMDVKRAVLRDLEKTTGATTLLATNTSALSVAGMSGALSDGSRFLGLHFFNPVPQMPLVEIVRAPSTSDESVERARGWVLALGKTPVVVADSPGFLVNRLLMPYFQEALALAAEGVSIADIDDAARGFGMAMGPFRVLDEVGLDVARHAAGTFAQAFPGRFVTSPLLERLVAAKRLGKKSGGGFWEREGRGFPPWKSRGFRPWSGMPAATKTMEPREIEARLFGAMAAEAEMCLAEKVCASERDVDLATIFAIGFPPFRGGLATWMRERGRSQGR